MTADRAMAASEAAPSNGILPVQEIRTAIADGAIISDIPLTAAQMQPASIDLRLGRRAWRVQSSFLPGPETRVADKLPRLAMHEIDLEGGAVLERGCLYIVELQESLALPAEISAMANPKSSTGRLDIFTRLITDGASEFEAVAAGYQGPLYAEISPRTFSVLVRPGSCLSQLRFRRGPSSMSDDAMIRLQQDVGLVRGASAVDIRDGVALSVNLTPADDDGIIGWRARKHAGLVDIDAPASCAVGDYWERLTTTDLVAGGLVLHPDEFYILASREFVTVPNDHAAEMRAYDTRVGKHLENSRQNAEFGSLILPLAEPPAPLLTGWWFGFFGIRINSSRTPLANRQTQFRNERPANERRLDGRLAIRRDEDLWSRRACLCKRRWLLAGH